MPTTKYCPTPAAGTAMLVADSGSTKTDWVLRLPPDNGGTQRPAVRFQTKGLNPIHLDDQQMAAVLATVRQWMQEQLAAAGHPLLTAPPAAQGALPLPALHVVFYGSGVRPDQEPRMERLLHETFLSPSSPSSPKGPSSPSSPRGWRELHIEAHSDLLGAARALCAGSEGLACILGTGANSCLYDGQHIVANTPAMGYILGDEGSGAVLGARFLTALYKGRLGKAVREAFESEMQLSLTAVIDRVYRQPLPNRWMASLSPFIAQHLDEPGVEEIVVQNFAEFISHNIEPYQRHDLPLQAVGSIAFCYKAQLCQAAETAGYEVGKIMRSPLDGLL